MDEPHLYAAFAYVSLNPVRAGLVERARHWPWSSVHANLAGRDDGLTTVAPALARVGDFAAFLEARHDPDRLDALRRAEVVGRPVGERSFLETLERQLDRRLQPKRRGRMKKTSS